MIIRPSTQLWTLSEDSSEYERFMNLLRGRLSNSLDSDVVNAHTLSHGLEQISFKDRIEIIHDGSDIRKSYSQKMPNLAKVRSLDGRIINGRIGS
jgi:hypothetical protein